VYPIKVVYIKAYIDTFMGIIPQTMIAPPFVRGIE
jgi:hypothetical protein